MIYHEILLPEKDILWSLQTFQLRAHIFQGHFDPGMDASGLLDLYIQVVFQGYTASTRVSYVQHFNGTCKFHFPSFWIFKIWNFERDITHPPSIVAFYVIVVIMLCMHTRSGCREISAVCIPMTFHLKRARVTTDVIRAWLMLHAQHFVPFVRYIWEWQILKFTVCCDCICYLKAL